MQAINYYICVCFWSYLSCALTDIGSWPFKGKEYKCLYLRLLGYSFASSIAFISKLLVNCCNTLVRFAIVCLFLLDAERF